VEGDADEGDAVGEEYVHELEQFPLRPVLVP
jgi:hypothetical protein